MSTSMSNNAMQGQQAEQLSKTNLYIRGLNQNTTDKDLVNMCSQYVNDILLMDEKDLITHII